jgi:hypothetical protein
MTTALPADGLSFRRKLLLAALAAAGINFILFYPGLLHHDAWAYFAAAAGKAEFTNWQPPLLVALWVPLQKIWYGPQPMFVLFLAAYWSGWALYADALKADGRKLAIWTFAAAFFPMAINFNGQLVKDVSMAVCFLAAAGIAAGLITGTIRSRTIALPFMWIMFGLGIFMRANSLFALPPLLDLLARASSRRWAAMGFIKRAVIVCMLSLTVAPAHMLADKYVFQVRDMKPISPLQIFDLGGITYFSGKDYFKGELGADFVERNNKCYTPRYWDTYGWVDCKGVYDQLKPIFGGPLTRLWVEAIASEPVAYLKHRFAHFNRFMQFFCTACQEVVFTGAQSTNQMEFTFEPTVLYLALDWLIEGPMNNSSFGQPYFWLLLTLAWAWAALAIPNERTRYVTLMVALSGAMYALGFGPVGIAHEYRYIYWTMLCALAVTPAVVMRVLLRSDAPLSYRLFPPLMVAGVILLREAVVRFVL